MPNYRRTFLAGGTFFFTLVTQRRRRLFADETARRCLGEAIREVQDQQPFEMTAIVLMPNHLHCIWTLPDEDDDYSSRWAQIKRHFVESWTTAGGYEAMISQARIERHERGIWQKRFWEHRIRNQTDLARHVNYIHYNPVKHGLVRCPHAWPHSSFHRWVKEGYYKQDWLCDCSAKPSVPPELLDLPDTGE
ncbi:MAG: transposase [Phycisphaerae bacterium]|nr:transposase [Phycisphaerae bacterium]